MEERFKEIQREANKIRMNTLEMCIGAGTGHVTSSFSCAEILTTLYSSGIMNYDANNPKMEKRDRFILSKGQASPILYNVLAEKGFFPREWISTFAKARGKFGVHLQGDVPGVEYTTGSLGHGLGYGAGVALAGKLNQNDYQVFVLLGDAELYEGSIWEAAMYATHNNLTNLTGIVDRNGYGVLGETEKIVKLESLDDKFRSFGWDVKRVDGHSVRDLYDALKNVKDNRNGKPLMVIADTIKGKGIKFMENVALWHGVTPQGKDAERALKELKEYIKESEN